MIVHDLSLSVKYMKIDAYRFCLMLVLLIPQIEISVLFVFKLRLHILLKESKIFWASTLVEAGACQDPGSFMSLKLTIPSHYL